MRKYVFVGLGNPGAEYKYTRHNAGAILLERIMTREYKNYLEKHYDISIEFAISCDFMNVSGQRIMSKFGQNINLIILVDDVETALSKVKSVYPTMGSRGQNGIKDIIRFYGSNFASIRIGIGRGSGALDEFVLGRFHNDELAVIEGLTEKVREELEKIMIQIEKA